MEREQRREHAGLGRCASCARRTRSFAGCCKCEAPASNELKLYRHKAEAAHARSRAELTELRAKLRTADRGARRAPALDVKADFA